MLEVLKKYQEKGGHLEHKNRLIRFILKNDKKNEFALNGLIFLKNPAAFVIKKRDGIAQYNGFAGKNIMVFYLIYLLLMNLYWNAMVYFGIHIWHSLWDWLKEIFFWYNLYHI